MLKTIIAVIALFLFMTGCQANNNATQEDQTNEKIVKVKNPSNDVEEDWTNQEVAEHLADISSRIPDVNDATAVVAGRYAVVGIDVNPELDRSRVGSIKYSVAESLRSDPHGANAVVVADPDTFNRLQEMGEQISKGHPGEAIMDELAAIVGRIMPQVPSDIPDTADDPTEQNEDQMEGNDQELDQIQQDQSNNHMNN